MNAEVQVLIEEQKIEVANREARLAQAQEELNQIVLSQTLCGKANENQQKIVALQQEMKETIASMHPKVAKLWEKENATAQEVSEINLGWHRVFMPDWLQFENNLLLKSHDYTAYIVGGHLYIMGGSKVISEKRLKPHEPIQQIANRKIEKLASTAQDWKPGAKRVNEIFTALEKKRRIAFDSELWKTLNWGLFDAQTEVLLKRCADNSFIAIVDNGLELIDESDRPDAENQSTQTVETSTTETVLPTAPEVIATIKRLDSENGAKNCLPIFYYRNTYPNLSRKIQDEMLCALAKASKIKLSPLQEVQAYTPEEVEAGIPQDVGGPLFFITVNEDDGDGDKKSTPEPSPTDGKKIQPAPATAPSMTAEKKSEAIDTTPTGEKEAIAPDTTPASNSTNSNVPPGQYRIILTKKRTLEGEYAGTIAGSLGEKSWSIVLDDVCNAIVSIGQANDSVDAEAFILDERLEEMRQVLYKWAKINLKSEIKIKDLSANPVWKCPEKFASATIKGLPVCYKKTERDKTKGVDIILAEVGACRAYFYLPLEGSDRYILGIAELSETNEKGWIQYKDSTVRGQTRFPRYLNPIRETAIAWFQEAAPEWKPEHLKVQLTKKS